MSTLPTEEAPGCQKNPTYYAITSEQPRKYFRGDTQKTETLADLVDCAQSHCQENINAMDIWFVLK